jgi:hypothetical protein
MHVTSIRLRGELLRGPIGQTASAPPAATSATPHKHRAFRVNHDRVGVRTDESLHLFGIGVADDERLNALVVVCQGVRRAGVRCTVARDIGIAGQSMIEGRSRFSYSVSAW